jgi:hypothetical protein
MIEVSITDEMREIANEKAEKLGQLRNSITRGEGNVAGFLGELVVQSVMGGELKSTRDYDIVFDNDVKADVKTKRCTSAPLEHFDCSISDYNTVQKCNRYIFVRVLKDYKKAWILGWYPKDQYYTDATFIQQGQLDRSNNWRAKCDCWNMPISSLKKIEEFKQFDNGIEHS